MLSSPSSTPRAQGSSVHETFPPRHHLEGFCYVHLHQYKVTNGYHMSGPVPHLPCHLKFRTFLQGLDHCILTKRIEGLVLSAWISSFVCYDRIRMPWVWLS